MKYIIILKVIILLSGCTYSIKTEIQNNLNQSNRKVDYPVYYVEDNLKSKSVLMIDDFMFNYEIKYGTNLSRVILDNLENNFKKVEFEPSKKQILRFEPDIDFRCIQNSYCDSKLILNVLDSKTNNIVKQYEFKERIKYTGGFFIGSMSFLSGLTICLLCPVTIPASGYYLQNKLEKGFNKFIENTNYKISLKMKSDKLFFEEYIQNNYKNLQQLDSKKEPITM